MDSIKAKVTKKLKKQPKTKKPKPVISLRLPDDIVSAIGKIEDSTNATRTEIITELLREALQLKYI